MHVDMLHNKLVKSYINIVLGMHVDMLQNNFVSDHRLRYGIKYNASNLPNS